MLAENRHILEEKMKIDDKMAFLTYGFLQSSYVQLYEEKSFLTTHGFGPKFQRRIEPMRSKGREKVDRSIKNCKTLMIETELEALIRILY